MVCKHCTYSREAYYLDEREGPEVCYVGIGDYCVIMQEIIKPGDIRQSRCSQYQS
ncbi:MAG: hypothetical protein WC343_03225 [Bacilli bacterium]|jgi:hypothetical protein